MELNSSDRQKCLDFLSGFVKQSEDSTIDDLIGSDGDENLSEFFYILAAIAHAKKAEISTAARLLRKVETSSLFAKHLARFLTSKGQFAVFQNAFFDTAAYDLFIHGSFYRKFKENSINSIMAYLKGDHRFSAKSKEKVLTIMDIGPGNGIFLHDLLANLTENSNLNRINLILVEPSKAMLQKVKETLSRENMPELSFLEFNKGAEKLTESEEKQIKEAAPDMINCSLSIHHMPDHQKVKVLQHLKSLNAPCFISEVYGDHDLLETDDPKFIYSVVQMYEHLIDSVVGVDAAIELQNRCIDEFLLTEAIRMLCSDREERIDYHMTIDQWRRVLEQAGFSLKTTNITHPSRFSCPLSYTICCD